jgi:uncharacterized protein (TIGR02145 family)
MLVLLCAVAFAQQIGSFTDPRDGKTYKTVKIDTQTWMAENLNYEADSSKCYYDRPANCQKYGRLYDWATAMKACPKGWHLPSNVEWDKLFRFADSTSSTESPYNNETFGELLRGTSGWEKNGNGTDKYGFSALPGGFGSSDGYFSDAGNNGFWWSATEGDGYIAYLRSMLYYFEFAYWDYDDKSYLFSVRCLQD